MVKLSTSILGRSLDNFQVQTSVKVPNWQSGLHVTQLGPISYNKALKTHFAEKDKNLKFTHAKSDR